MKSRIANTVLIQQAMEKLEKLTAPLKERPGHAGAVLQGLDQITRILNLMEEANTDQDPKADRAIQSTRAYWASKKPTSNEAFLEIGESLLNAPLGLQAILKRLPTSQPTEITIHGVRIHNYANADLQVFSSLLSKVLGLLRPYKSCPIAIVRKDQMPPSNREHAGAFYTHSEDMIHVAYPPPDSRDLEERLLHEFGHRVWFRELDADQRETWEEGFKSFPFVTSYASTNPKEEFAETFAYWRLNKLHGELLLRIEGL